MFGIAKARGGWLIVKSDGDLFTPIPFISVWAAVIYLDKYHPAEAERLLKEAFHLYDLRTN